MPTPANYSSPHLTSEELAARWRTSTFTICRNHRKWGLKPIRIGKRNLFPIAQIEEAERRCMIGEVA